MWHYLLKRLALIPLTLFFIILVNFIIINLSPGEPTDTIQLSATGDAVGSQQAYAFSQNDRYFQFREFYGLTLPVIFNRWPWIPEVQVQKNLEKLIRMKEDVAFLENHISEYDSFRQLIGDQAPFTMQKLLSLLKNKNSSPSMKELASLLFMRGGTRLPEVAPGLSQKQREKNEVLSNNNRFLQEHVLLEKDTREEREKKIQALQEWYEGHKEEYIFEPNSWQKTNIFFTKTRFFRYMSKVLTLDFGTLRNDPNKSVIYEVTKRFKYSLTLALTPMVISFALSLFFGFIMAFFQNRFPDYFLNTLFLILYAIPVFVVAPFLIEYFALKDTLSFKFPLGGFSSPKNIYNELTSTERLQDIAYHLVLPMASVMYGSLAASARLARNACLEFKKAPFITAAFSRGIPVRRIYTHHIGKNVAIIIVTSLAGSLGIILGGSLIVETLFEIDGFGRFFYQAILNRDYNVMMFSAFAGAFLSLLGYLLADIAYTLLDPRVSLE